MPSDLILQSWRGSGKKARAVPKIASKKAGRLSISSLGALLAAPDFCDWLSWRNCNVGREFEPRERAVARLDAPEHRDKKMRRYVVTPG